jgi:hypothetical protein
MIARPKHRNTGENRQSILGAVMFCVARVACSTTRPIQVATMEHVVLHPVARTLSRLLEEPSLATTLQGVYFIFYIFRRYMFRLLLAIFSEMRNYFRKLLHSQRIRCFVYLHVHRKDSRMYISTVRLVAYFFLPFSLVYTHRHTHKTASLV